MEKNGRMTLFTNQDVKRHQQLKLAFFDDEKMGREKV